MKVKDERTKTSDDPKDALIAQMAARLEKLEARLGPDEAEAAAAPTGPQPWPRAVYRESTKKDQIDHPGHEGKIVGDQAAFDAAIADGWHAEPQDEYPKVDKSAKKKTAA